LGALYAKAYKYEIYAKAYRRREGIQAIGHGYREGIKTVHASTIRKNG
jgi:hypothetical protein